jgi:hypothetical protein
MTVTIPLSWCVVTQLWVNNRAVWGMLGKNDEQQTGRVLMFIVWHGHDKQFVVWGDMGHSDGAGMESCFFES